MKRALTMIGFLSVAMIATPVFADNSGTIGFVKNIKVNTSGSDEFAVEHGSVTLRHKRPGKPPGVAKYSFGGSRCPGRDLSTEEIQLIAFALRGGIRVKPRWKPGQGQGTKCLVAFELHRGGSGNH